MAFLFDQGLINIGYRFPMKPQIFGGDRFTHDYVNIVNPYALQTYLYTSMYVYSYYTKTTSSKLIMELYETWRWIIPYLPLSSFFTVGLIHSITPSLSTLGRRQKALTHLNAHASTLGVLKADKATETRLKKREKYAWLMRKRCQILNL